MCLRYANSHFEAEDILQEGFIMVFKDLHQYSGTGPLGAWIRKVILRSALKYVRSKKKEMNVVELKEWDSAVEINEDLQQKVSAEDIIKAMQGMPIGYRTILNLYFLEGYSHQEISQILNISVGTSKSQLKRGKQYIQRLFQQEQVSKKVAYGK